MKVWIWIYSGKRFKTLFVDLDETLIHTVNEEQEADYVLNINGKTSKTMVETFANED